ncbi:MAG: efflux RND transporter permease subunit [Labilithrix sp.]|nr:efflux RND transporter permease subunit [Labilithrix sp.]MCW5811649.1 efflux RND transporter permease subunit [Labilithrix sp.]
MWLVRLALRRPLTIVVLVIALLFGGGLALRKAPVDIFPSLGVPVVYVVQPYGGMSPTQMEGQLVGYYEYHFLYINGIEHIESQSIQGMAMLKLYFHPGTDIAQSLSQVTAMAFRATSFMPPGTLPPFIVRFDVGSVPVGQLVFSSDTRSGQEVQDAALFKVRPLLATIPGVSAPPPSGGKVRMVVAYVDPERLRAFDLSTDEVATAIAKGNLTLPAGNVRIGGKTRIASTNAMVESVKELETLPLRGGAGVPVLLRDVARVEDSSDVVTNVALVNGRDTVYMPLTKLPDASTVDVVAKIKAALPNLRAQVPDDVHVDFEFDQSVYVKRSVNALMLEGALGALLTALTVLFFLRSWRSALIVVLTIPLSIVAAVIALRLAGHTINIMTLSGLALAVGILVDEATVAIENIHTHLARGKGASRAVVDAMTEVMQPRLLAMLCILAVFIPTFFLVGVARALFPPLALAVGFAMIASYVLSSTVVPVLAARLFANVRTAEHPVRAERYGRFIGGVTRAPWIALAAYLVLCVPSFMLASRVGTELFPRPDNGQLQMRVRAPAGTQLERTVDIVRGVDRAIRDEAGADHVRMTLANIGNPAWTYPVNALYVFNAGPHEAMLMAQLQGHGRIGVADLEERLRQRLAKDYPDTRFSFEAGDIVSQVLSVGSPTPIQVTVSGKNLKETRAYAQRVRDSLAKIDQLRDVQIPVALDYPTLAIDIDRERAGQFGLTVDRIGKSLVSATSSSALTTPIFWTDPVSGVGYRVQLRVPEARMGSLDDLSSLPIVQDGSSRAFVRDVATIREDVTPGELDHYNSQRAIHVTANVRGGDLARATDDVEEALARAGDPPKGAKVALHGQAEQMRVTLASLREGLGLAVVVVLLLLMVSFQSIREPLVVLSTTLAALSGVIVALFITGTTLNVQSMMGAIMAIGVSVANAVLLVIFAKAHRREGASAADAMIAAAKGRVRPILMTTLAMVAGMIPTALAIGEGAEQSAPLGRAVIGGLLGSTLATLVFVPALYVLIGKRGLARAPSLDPDEVTA